ncbi:MAG: fadA [Cyanobacteria bacterium RYN_339]|nr:fadA [Cyanobacteria bacterium RYN_339]
MTARLLAGRPVWVVDGARTPFLRSGTGFADLMSYELGSRALAGLMIRADVDPERVDRLIMGTVIQEPRTSNLAREIGLAAGLPQHVPAYTITAACTSANVAIQSAMEAIAVGAADVILAGGAETLSDVPIRFSKPVRQRLIASQKARGPADYVKLLAGLKPADAMPDTPAIAEFSTGLTMGENAERLAKRYGITREAQDLYALASHQRAAQATADGKLADQIVPTPTPPDFVPMAADNGVRGDSTIEKLSSLSPVYDRKFGTVTAGNASFLTDGAAVCLLMSEEAVKAQGREPLARIVGSVAVALDPVEELLLGPAFAIPPLLAAAGITLADVGVIELHEAFAAQMLANLHVLEAQCGPIDPAKINAWGGSLAIGHPFGATGARLVITAARRMKAENARWGLVAACAAGALGHAMLLERNV